jgi:hypothetical protein
MFEFIIGDVGQCKSYFQAKILVWLLKRSVRVQKKYKLPIREVWVNCTVNKQIREKYSDRLKFWHRPREMIFSDYPLCKEYRRNFDCVWEEMAVELPSRLGQANTDQEIWYFFSQHRHRGIQIFGNAQDYIQVDKLARARATKVFEARKFFGSRDPNPTLPPVKFVWGLAGLWKLDKQCIRVDDMDRKRLGIIPEFSLIEKSICKIYDMTEDIRPAPDEPFFHSERKCITCGYTKYSHL